MRVLLSTFGSRGDIQPVAALADALQTMGAQALVCAPPGAEFCDVLHRARVPLLPAISSVKDWVATAKEQRLTLPEKVAPTHLLGALSE